MVAIYGYNRYILHKSSIMNVGGLIHNLNQGNSSLKPLVLPF